jgi:hypothetical protein
VNSVNEPCGSKRRTEAQYPIDNPTAVFETSPVRLVDFSFAAFNPIFWEVLEKESSVDFRTHVRLAGPVTRLV